MYQVLASYLAFFDWLARLSLGSCQKKLLRYSSSSSDITSRLFSVSMPLTWPSLSRVRILSRNARQLALSALGSLALLSHWPYNALNAVHWHIRAKS